MEISNVIALLALILTLGTYLFSWNMTKNKEDKESNEVLINLNAEMKYNTKQLNDIKETLKSIEEQVTSTGLTVARHNSDITTLFKHFDKILYRIRRLENHVGLKGEDDKNEK